MLLVVQVQVLLAVRYSAVIVAHTVVPLRPMVSIIQAIIPFNIEHYVEVLKQTGAKSYNCLSS
jgi:hypothetical protein